MSQWSLTFEVRKSINPTMVGVLDNASQWSLTFEVRKRTMDFAEQWQLLKSQWSLTFEVRKRPHQVRAPTHPPGVAMEPDL